MKKVISVLLSVLIFSSCFVLTAYADEQPAADSVKESFKAYLEETCGKGEEFEYRNFGTVEGYEVVYGYNRIDPLEGTTTEIGDYCLTTPATQGESAGLYLYKDNTFYPFNDKSEFLKNNSELIRKIVDLITDSFGEGLSVGQVICRYPAEPSSEAESTEASTAESEYSEPETEPVTYGVTEPDDNIYPKLLKPEEVDYISIMKQAGYDTDIAQYVGTVNDTGGNVDVLIYSFKGEIKEISIEKEIGDYIFRTGLHSPNELGLFIAHFNYYSGWDSVVYPLDSSESHYYGIPMRNVYEAVKSAEKGGMRFGFVMEHRDGEDGLKCYDAIKKSFGAHDYSKILGQVDGCYVVYAGNNVVSPAEYWETLGKYTFMNYNYVARYPLGIYIVKDDTAYSLKDAYEKSVIKNESLKDVALLAGGYVDVIISENGENVYEAGSECIGAIWRDFGKHDYYTLLGKTGESYIVYAGNYEVREANYIETFYGSLSGYEFENPNQVGKYELGLYIVNNNKAYTLKDAFDKKIISFEELKDVADAILKAKVEIKVTSFLVEPTADGITETICPKPKKSNPIKITAKAKSIKLKKLKKKKVTIKPLSIKNAEGTVNITKIKKGTSAKYFEKIKVNPTTGAVTLAKGRYKAGSYKIKLKIIASGNKVYAAANIKKTIKIIIK